MGFSEKKKLDLCEGDGATKESSEGNMIIDNRV